MPRRRMKKRTYRKKSSVVRRNRGGRRYIRRVSKNTGETKLVKSIRDGPFTVTTPYMLVTPYQEEVNVDGQAVVWPQYNDTNNIHGRNFIKLGSGYNQRIGRRITIKGSSVEIKFSLTSGAVSGSPEYPLYANLRVIHGWVKNGYDRLNDVQMDMSGGSMYKEIPFSKYKILSDRVITRQCHPSVSFGKVLTEATGGSALPGYESAVYKPLSFKFRWGGGPMTFSDSLQTPVQIGHGAVYHGWCPFFIICNPYHGSHDSSINLQVEYCKRVIAYKDA